MKMKNSLHLPFTSQKIIWYDGVCNLCHWSVRLVKRHDKKGIFSYQPLQEVGLELNASTKKAETNPGTIIYQRGQKLYKRSDAVLMIARDLGGVWQWFYCLKIIPKSWRDGVYDLVAKYRYKIFGRKIQCEIQ